MNLHSDYPFWLIKEGLIKSFPKLEEDRTTEVVVIGGGITGALIANQLTELGIAVEVIEKRHIAHGSTSASTALLQYEIDVPLFKLIKIVGEDHAVKAYKLCANAIDEIGKIASKFKNNADFEKQESLYFASYIKHKKEIIEPEFEARNKAGLDVRLLDENKIKKDFKFSAPAAILSKQAGRVNPYKLCHYLLDGIVKKGNFVFDSTEITEIKEKNGFVFLKTDSGFKVKAKYVIIACGYESQKHLSKKVTDFNSTYAIITKPLNTNVPWKNDTLLWETKIPYLYMRNTSDNRIIVGGFDENFVNAEHRDKLIHKKKIQLEKSLKKMFPLLNFQTDFAWAGTFGETEDGLPFIGSYDKKRILFAMGYGGNGITFSLIASKILADIIRKKHNPNADIFSFKRIKNFRKNKNN